MLKFQVSVVVLFLLVLSPLSSAQEVQQSGADPAGAASESSPARPAIPDEISIESSVGTVLFPHKRHMKFGCVACHHQIHAQELDTPHPDYLTSPQLNCQDCHDASSENSGAYYTCSDCHPSEPEDIADETLSSKVVVHKSCWKCHKTGTGVEASQGCGECHLKGEE